MKKLLLSFILISIFLICIKYFFSDYKLEYRVNDYNIKSYYSNNRYYFEFNGEYDFNFEVYKNKTLSKIKVKDIIKIDGEDYLCIYPVINDIETYPLCSMNDEIISYHLIDDPLLDDYKTKKDEVKVENQNYVFYENLDENTYIALWNYKGYIIMNKDNYRYVELFDIDKYDNSLAFQINNLIYSPNYSQEHEYNEIVVLDIVTQEKKSIKLSYNIDYDSYFVGYIKNKLYIFDNKYSILYELNLKNNKLSIIGNNEKGYVKYENGEFISCSKTEYKVNKIKYNVESLDGIYLFDENKVYKQFKENLKIKTKILDKEVTVINDYKDNLYYIYDNYLYKYTLLNGEDKVFYYFELNFNKNKTIFIYNK